MNKIPEFKTILEVFAFVKDHLLLQNVRAYDSGSGVCAYRALHGLKCAVGCLISDEKYSEELEGIRLDDETVLAALPACPVFAEPETIAMLRVLQFLHDSVPEVLWSAALKAVESVVKEEKTNWPNRYDRLTWSLDDEYN